MKNTRPLTGRAAIVTGLPSAGGVMLARYSTALPPTYGNLLRIGDDITYAAHRTLLPGESLAKEYAGADITSFPAGGTSDPRSSRDTALVDAYSRRQRASCADWRLSVEARVAAP